jgi:cytochrome c-type biogenesis protein CcsB
VSHADLAALSDHLFTVVVVVYALAMVLFAADFAFGRLARRPVAAQAVPAREGAPALVGAASGAAGLAGGASDASSDAPPTLAAAVQGAGRVGAVRRVAFAAVAVGWGVHVAEVATRGFAAGRVPWGDMYEFSSAVCLVAVTGFLALSLRQRAGYLGVFVMVPVVLYLGLAGTVLYAKAGPLQPVLQSYWLKIHVVAAVTATGAFMVAGVTSCLSLVRRRYESVVAAGRSPRAGAVAARLPESAAIERLEFRVIAFAFPIWSFAVIAGAIWAESAWGRYWGWDPKETGSFITWVIYAAYLHARATPSFRRAAPGLALFGFAALLFNYYVINLVVAGLHSYAGV